MASGVSAVSGWVSPLASETQTQEQLNEDPLANKETFLKLLVAQIQYQNPMNPADGLQFLTELAQFTQVEQSVAMRQELQTIRETITGVADASSAEQS